MSTFKHYPVTGITAGWKPSGERPLRMEIDAWWSSQDLVHVNQKSLLIQALSILEHKQVTEKLSWFRIAGIHGYPLVQWDEEDPVAPGGFYCQHSTVVFPIWHRPYMLLLEQVLYDIMKKEVIPGFDADDQPALIEAADTWRWPYWDWALKRHDATGAEYDLPQLFYQTTVEVRTKTGVSKFDNPFSAFKMPNGVAMGDQKALGKLVIDVDPFNYTKATSKHPKSNSQTSAAWVNGAQDNTALVRELNNTVWRNGGNLTQSLREAFYRVLQLKDWNSFATTDSDSNGNMVPSWLSCEGIHNNIHNIIGGVSQTGNTLIQGHMTALEVAAFDPIFWLHHGNVDRQFALWQGLHPDEYYRGSAQALLPFRTRETDDAHHTPFTVRDTTALGYAYPELQTWLPKYQTNGAFDPTKLQADLQTIVNRLYNSTRTSQQNAERSKTAAKPTGAIEDVRAAGASTAAAATVPKIRALVRGAPPAKGQEPIALDRPIPEVLKTHDYVVNVVYESFALNSSFSIHIFIGPPTSPPPYTFAAEPAAVGLVYNLVSTLPSNDNSDNDDHNNASTDTDDQKPHCQNCARRARRRQLCTGQVILTSALLTRYKQQIVHPNDNSPDNSDHRLLRSMDPRDVVPFLRTHLAWRVTDAAGREVVDQARVGLKVAVAVGEGRHYQDEGRASEYGDYRILYGVTEAETAGNGAGTGARVEDGLFPNNEEWRP